MCRGLATRFYRYRSGSVVVHAYQTPGTLSHLTYAIGALLCVEFVSLKSSLSLSPSYSYLPQVTWFLVVEYGKKNCKGWILFDGKHIYIYLYIALNIFINMYVIMRDWDIVFIMSSICTISCIAFHQWHIGFQKVKNINIVKHKFLSELNLAVWW